MAVYGCHSRREDVGGAALMLLARLTPTITDPNNNIR